MATRIDVTSADAVLKDYYTNQRVTELTYKDAPLYAMLAKKKFEGKRMPLPLQITNPQGRSATFATAQTNKAASRYEDFLLTRAKDYGVASIDTESILASESNAGAFLKLAVHEIDCTLATVARSVAWSCYGDGNGALGQVNAEPSTNSGDFTITLKNIEDVVKFELDQTVVIYSALTGGSQRTSDGSDDEWVVEAIDEDAGTVTLTGSYDASGDIDANDYIFVEGDRGNKLTGLAGWLPTTAPGSSDDFFGVNRSVHATRLGGIRIASANKPKDEALIDAARRIARGGGSPDHLFCDFTTYASIEKTLSSRARTKSLEVGGVGFTALEVSGPKGPINVVADRDCPADKSYMLTMDTWGFYHLKEPILLLDMDGNRMLREGSADAYEVRVGSYSQVGCVNPGANGVLDWTAS